MVVTPHVARQVVDNLHERLTKIYLHYSLGVVTLKEHTKLPCIVAFMDTYVVSSPYSFSIRKCGVVSCCSQIHSPQENGIRDIVMQRQLAPCADVDKAGHFMHGDDTLREASVNKICLLTCLIFHPLWVIQRSQRQRNGQHMMLRLQRRLD